jgi:valyl-tRNA synthetase
MKVGRRLAIKLLNASKFVLSRPEPHGPVTAAVDCGLLASLARLVDDSTNDLESYNYARVLERTESFFWSFCDDYLELVKGRRYGDQGHEPAASANSALLTALSTMLRLFAPFLPFVTEEVWSWWQEGSVHRVAWPTAEEVLAASGGAERSQPSAAERSPKSAAERSAKNDRGVDALALASAVLGAIRKKKSEEQRPFKTRVARAVIHAPSPQLALLEDVQRDLCASGLIDRLESSVAETFQVDVELAAPEPPQDHQG